jgi:hypothetical protein
MKLVFVIAPKNQIQTIAKLSKMILQKLLLNKYFKAV